MERTKIQGNGQFLKKYHIISDQEKQMIQKERQRTIDNKRPKLDKKYQSQSNISPIGKNNKSATKILSLSKLLTLPNEKFNTEGMRPDSGASKKNSSRKGKKKLVKGSLKNMNLTDKLTKKKSMGMSDSLTNTIKETKAPEFYEPVKLDVVHRDRFYRNKDIFLDVTESINSNRTIKIDWSNGSNSSEGKHCHLSASAKLDCHIDHLRHRKKVENDIKGRRDLSNLAKKMRNSIFNKK